MATNNSTKSSSSLSISSAELNQYVRSLRRSITNEFLDGPEGVFPAESPLDTLKGMTIQINKTNEQAVKTILNAFQRKKHMWKDQKMFDLVKDYFSNSFLLSELCNAFEDCLKRASDRQLILRVAVELFKGEEKNGDGSSNRYARALEELNKFRNTEDPFAKFSQVLDKVIMKQKSLVDKLNRHDKKFKYWVLGINLGRIISGTIFMSAAFTLTILAVLVKVAGMPAMAPLFGVVASASFSICTSIESLSKSYVDELKRKIRLISSMKQSAFIVLNDSLEIRNAVDKLERLLQSLMENVDFANGEDGAAVGLMFGEIERSMQIFKETLEDLGKYASTCSKHLKNGRLLIQNKICNY